MGHSAGGLLVAGAANLQPDLFLGVIAQSPFVDVVSTLLDPSLPLTPAEWNEWGDPARDRAAFETIRSYSPYDNVTAKAYPAMLVTTSLTDPRVTYWEPAKWVARLRSLKRDRNPLLLMTETASGHDGPSGRFERLKKIATLYAFAINLAGQSRPASGQRASSRR
jgi:oligopeptidase B